MRINAVIIRRSTDENTVALVSAECDSEMIDSVNELFGAISHAVTRWAKNGQGKKLLHSNRGNINIGDLVGCVKDKRLVQDLGRRGIAKLTVESHQGDATAWDFDDNLYDQEMLHQDGDSAPLVK